jgi:hypothetical protein
MATSGDDSVVAARGIEAYREMSRDAEVAADTDLRLVGMMPGVQLQPPDETEEGQRSTLFCESVLRAMQGSLLSVLRDEMLREAITTGFLVAEPIERMLDLPEFGGPVIGLDSIRVRPSEGFIDNIMQGPSGEITLFRQMAALGMKEAKPE